MLVAEAIRGKALAVVLTNAAVTDEAGIPVDLSELLVDGVGADAEEEEAVAETLAEAADDAGAGTSGTPAAGGAASIAIPTIPGA
jgi:trigger factor